MYGSPSLPASIDLAALGASGVRINGIDDSDYNGYNVANAGDVNGDGFDDVLIDARDADSAGNGRELAGEYYLVFGGASLPMVIDLAMLGTAGVTVFGAESFDRGTTDHRSVSVSGAGDVNGDGFDDLIIGAHAADSFQNAREDAGEAYVIFGAPTMPTTIDLQVNGTAGIIVYGDDEQFSFFNTGFAVSGGGDIDGDGFDDVFIGAPDANVTNQPLQRAGDSYLLYGGDVTSSVTHAGTATDETLTGDVNANVMVGGRGDDTLVGGGGADVLRGGEGDDVLAIGDLSFRRVVGGNGDDTLLLDIDSADFDLTAIPDNRIVGVEGIDLSGGGIDTLTLDVLEVLNLSNESNTLVVRRDASDVVNMGGGWTLQNGELIGGDLFEVFTQGAAVLKLQSYNAFFVNLTVDVADASEAAMNVVIVTATTNFVVSGNLMVDIAISGTGITTADYLLSNAQITIPDGQTSGNVTFTVQDDSLVETLHETATLVITNLAGGLLAGVPVQVTIEDNDFLTPLLASTAPDPTNATVIPVTVDFGQPVNGFDMADVLVSGGSMGSFVDLTGGQFSFDVTPSTDGVVSIDITAGAATDAGGKETLAATQLVRISDRTPPLPVISGGLDPTNVDPFDVSIDFGESVTGFVAGDITVTNGSVTNLTDLGGGMYTATIDALADAAVTVDVASDVASDAAGNGNLAARSTPS